MHHIVRARAPLVAVWLLAAALLAPTQARAARLSLVIGNDQYRTVSALKNARNDARLMADTLRAAGFEVVGGVREDLDRAAMTRAINQFRARIAKGDEVVFYYAGHGVQVGANQYLLPTDIDANSEDQVNSDAIRLVDVQEKLGDARFALLVIDACRNNPFPPQPGRTRSIGDQRGLAAPTELADGSAVILAASRGQTALDQVPGGSAGNGLFTHALVQAIRTPGLDVVSALRQARDVVEDRARRVNHQQRPALVDETRGRFVFFAGNAPAAAAAATAAATPPQAAVPNATAGLEDESWALCRSAATPGPCQAYLDDYAQGRYARLARTRLADLQARAAPAPAAAAQPAPQAQAAAGTVSMEAAVNEGFMLWGSSWGVDRYIPGSISIDERTCSASDCKLRGTFRFSRMGRVNTIPFAAQLDKRGEGDYSATRLCYADNTSGMSDCADLPRRR